MQGQPAKSNGLEVYLLPGAAGLVPLAAGLPRLPARCGGWLGHGPNFDPSQRAFYHARAIENPTCRWSTWCAIGTGLAPKPDLAITLQVLICTEL